MKNIEKKTVGKIRVVVGVKSYGRVNKKDYNKYGYREIVVPYYISQEHNISYDSNLLEEKGYISKNECVLYELENVMCL